MFSRLSAGSLLLGLALLAGSPRTLFAARHLVRSAEEVQALCPRLEPGDELIWKDGTYPSVKLRLKAAGDAGRPVLLRAEHPGKVVFTGVSSITLDGVFLAVEGFTFRALDNSVKVQPLVTAEGSSDCRFSDCLIDGRDSAESMVDSKWVSLRGTRHEVSRCTFLDKRNMGALLVVWMKEGEVPAHIIRNNRFTRPATLRDEKGRPCNGQEAIRIGTSTYSLQDGGCVVEGNWFDRCDGERAEIISNKSCSNRYEGNVITFSAGALTLRHGNGCVVRGNYILADGDREQGGIRIIGENHVVEDNVIVGVRGDKYKAPVCIVKGESGPKLNGYFPVKNLLLRGNVLIGCPCGIVENVGLRPSQVVPAEGVKMQDNLQLSADTKRRTEAETQMKKICNNAGITWKSEE